MLLPRLRELRELTAIENMISYTDFVKRISVIPGFCATINCIVLGSDNRGFDLVDYVADVGVGYPWAGWEADADFEEGF